MLVFRQEATEWDERLLADEQPNETVCLARCKERVCLRESAKVVSTPTVLSAVHDELAECSTLSAAVFRLPYQDSLTAQYPGPAALSLGLSTLRTMFSSASCCSRLDGISRIGDAPGRLPRPRLRILVEGPVPLSSILASARSTTCSEKDDVLMGPTRQAAGGRRC